MIIKTGCDVVHIDRFQKSAENGGEHFLNNIFSTHELAAAANTNSLAGIFAAKEAVLKALELNPGEWKKIEIVKNDSGRPEVILGAMLSDSKDKISSHDISVSHDGDYAFATAVFIIL